MAGIPLPPPVDKAIWDPENEPDLPLELLDMRMVSAGMPLSNQAQKRVKKFFEENYPAFMKMKRELEREYREQREARGAQVVDPGVEAALKAAGDWLERQGAGLPES